MLKREVIAPGDRSLVTIEAIAAALGNGQHPTDDAFDAFLPYDLRVASGTHWTPLAVAARAATWLAELDVQTVVDIGSGAGKFCIAAALATRCRFVGIEQRPRLVAAAAELAHQFHVDDRVTFTTGVVEPSTLPSAEAYYLYNPFGENWLAPTERLDAEVELGDDRYVRDIAIVEEVFRRAPKGVYVFTYNGFGGRMPRGYDQIRVDRTLPNILRLWEKTRNRQSAGASA